MNLNCKKKKSKSINFKHNKKHKCIFQIFENKNIFRSKSLTSQSQHKQQTATPHHPPSSPKIKIRVSKRKRKSLVHSALRVKQVTPV